VAPPLTTEWTGRDVTVAAMERELARLRQDAVQGDDASPGMRTSVMTHVAWAPPEWLDAAEATLAGMAERHPSRTLILVPQPEEPDGLDAELSIRCFPAGESHICSEVIELLLRGNRVNAPSSLVLPLAISDLPLFCRWRGEPPFGAAPWEQLVEIADRMVVDSSEWEDLAYGDLARVFERTAVSDIAWARTYEWRVELAKLWPAIREQEIRVRGPRAEATLLRAWLNARLDRAIRPIEPASELGVRLGGEDLRPPRGGPPSASDLLSAELDKFSRDRIYEEAVAAAASVLR
jgi:Glucose-6-phosphate dehydrogenase subunit N-terminal domain